MYPGTVHGAYLSGIKAAQRIVASIKPAGAAPKTTANLKQSFTFPGVACNTLTVNDKSNLGTATCDSVRWAQIVRSIVILQTCLISTMNNGASVDRRQSFAFK